MTERERELKREEIETSEEYQKLSRYQRATYMTKALYGEDYFSKIGRQGALNGNNRPFNNREIASKAGFKSGKIRRANSKSKNK